ncbi:hypothetical protein [Halogeometricum limi]|uniref:Uncharacterized protein n=1 Tax=Halogeometricum limi TaxID=555875 RepID=A0A1I6FPU5_9EURY|nr:hypothetical protein [Halogeometricum limi]SFR31946.1 hypothetical protein SAMN04488124_0029 [Halogeometricum limi]
MASLPDADGEEDLPDVEQELREDIEAKGARPGDALDAFVRQLRATNDEAVRGIGWYDAGSCDILYLREEIQRQFTEAENRERIKSFAMKGLSDPRSDDTLEDFGELDATVRWYENAIVAIYPLSEWSGVVATFDRRASPLVDAAMEHLY